MNLHDYVAELKHALPNARTEEALTLLAPLTYIPVINTFARAEYISRAVDKGVSILDMIPTDPLTVESFNPLPALKNSAATIVKGAATTLTAVGTLAVVQDKTILTNTIAELKRLKDPKLLIGLEFKLVNAYRYPLQLRVAKFTDIAGLLSKQLTMLKTLGGFFNGSRYHITVGKDIDVSKWLAPLAALGGKYSGAHVSTPMLYGNVVVASFNQHGVWTTRKIDTNSVGMLEKYTIPGPLMLASHLKASKSYIEEIWAQDAILSASITDLYALLEKGRNSPEKVLMRKTINAYYSNVLSSTLELALAYVKLCETAAGKAIALGDKS
jgi:hypothetical protein